MTDWHFMDITRRPPVYVVLSVFELDYLEDIFKVWNCIFSLSLIGANH